MVKEFSELKPIEVKELVPGVCDKCLIIRSFANGVPLTHRTLPQPDEVFELTDWPARNGGNEMVTISGYRVMVVLGCQIRNPGFFARLNGEEKGVEVQREVVYIPLFNVLDESERKGARDGNSAKQTEQREITKPYVWEDPHTTDVTDRCPAVGEGKIEGFDKK